MIEVHNATAVTRFQDLKPGAQFQYEGARFLCVLDPAEGDLWALHMELWELYYLDPNTQVEVL